MSDLERFQQEHGAAWTAATQSPAFGAAFVIATNEKLQTIAGLSDDEIATRGNVILADLRGHLNYENALISLNQPKKFVFQDLGQPTYPSPEEELREEEAAPPETETANAAATFNISEFEVPPPIQPKPKRKYRKRRKRRKQ